MSQKRQTYLQEFEPPPKKVISDRQVLIKKLYNKQQTIDNLPQAEKIFERSTEIVPLTNLHAGQCSSERLQAISNCVSEIEQYKAAGLNNEEIQLYIDWQNGLDFVVNKHKNHQPELLLKHLAEIEVAVKVWEQKQKQDGIEDQSNTLQYTKNNHLSQPMNYIKIINDGYKIGEERLTDSKINRVRKRIRKLENKIKPQADSSKILTNASQKISTYWDMQETVEITKPEPPKTYSCKPQTLYTIKDGKIITLNSSTPNPMCKSSAEGIKSTFKNYEAGIPNKILFIKNLHSKVKQSDLQNIFSHYSNFSVKLMNGKMRGQAFVTFSDESTAIRALHDLNGTVIYEKPIVIQYGKKII